MKLKEWMQLEKLKKIPKNQILIGGLVGILLLVVAIPVDSGKTKTEEAEKTEQEETAYGGTDTEIYEKKMERRLAEVLESMDGVGKVEVMITLKDNGESVVEKDNTTSNQNTNEGENGTTRSATETQSQEETVFSEQQGNGQQPFISKEVTPQIEGVLVVAEGGGSATVVKNISDAVLALFPVEVHKIKVVKMNL